MSAKQTSPSSGKNKILYQVGARLEAMDYTLNWYSAKICRVDEKEKKVLIHFEGWNHRYDEWIACGSERLRPHSRQHSQQDTKDEKQEACDYQDWKVNDRVLAKWQDCKFYPAKIVKSLADGAYEVLFYDGIKKFVHRVNIKPENRKQGMVPVNKMEHEKEIQERKQRRQQMASARAERARKRSAETSPTPPIIAVKRKDGRSRKARTQDRDDFGAVCESSMSSPSGEVPEVDEVSLESDKMDVRNLEGGVEEEISAQTVKAEPENVEENETKRQSVEKDTDDTAESAFTHIKTEMILSTDKHKDKEHVESVESVINYETTDVGVKMEHSPVSPVLQLSGEMQNEDAEAGTSMKEEPADNSSCSEETKESGELSIKSENKGNAIEASMLSTTETIKTDPMEGTSESVGELKAVLDKGDELKEVKLLESHVSVPPVEESESSNDTSLCESNTSAELNEEQTDSLKMFDIVPKIETDHSVDSKPTDSTLPKLKTSKGPKIKRTLSRAERLSRSRKNKSGLTLKMGFKGSPVKVSKQVETKPKQTDTPGGSSSPKGAPSVKPSIKSEKTVQRRRSFKGGRSSISPRGYGYSMAFMDMEKPVRPVVNTEEEAKVSLPEPGLTALDISTQNSISSTASPISPTSSTGIPTENQPLPKKQTYQAKKFRLDQITGKLSAQRQSEAKAAAHSPSAFQVARPHSSPPPQHALPTPSPPANPTPPYPRESYPPPGPPPLIYSPMPGSCCPTPHRQHMYGPHPAHGMHLPPGHMRPHPDYPPPTSGYMLYGMHYPPPPPPPPPPGHCIGQCSCSAGPRQPVYHPLPPGAPPPPSRDSALAQLMQCEQRILHGAPHYREAAPPGPWITHRHGHPPTQSFIPVSRHPDDLWHAHEERTAHAPPVSQAPPPPASISPTSDSGKQPNRRSRKSERPLPTKALPSSSLPATESSLATAMSKKDSDNYSTTEHKVAAPKSEGERPKVSVTQPEILHSIVTSISKNVIESESKTTLASNQLSTAPDKKEENTALSGSISGCLTTANVPSSDAVSVTPGQETGISLSGFIPGAKNRKGKELAPKELVIEIDHNKYKCKVPGCDKSFRKESGLEYHVKYYHEQQPGMKRKKTVSVRSDSTPETSPEFGSRRVTKRRIHRSSAPAQLSGTPHLTSPSSSAPVTGSNSEPIDLEQAEIFRSVSMDSEPFVSQDTDLEIEGGGVDLDSIDPGMVGSMEVEEEEDVNGDVIRCLCNETEEGGFMIQCDQCLTWQHSECVGLSELTVPPNYLCYVCTNPRGLRRSAKHKNDFDWFRRGTLACMPFVSVEEPEYNAELNLATHGLMGDLHDVNNCLRSLKLKFELLRNPSHPDLKYWKESQRANNVAGKTSPVESSILRAVDGNKTGRDSSSTEKGECSNVLSLESNGQAVVNGHAEMRDSAQNGSVRVKLERPSTPPPSLDGPGDSNNNIQDKKGPVAVTLPTVADSPSSSHGPLTRTDSGVEFREGRSGTVTEEEEPMSPIPALVPVGGQNSCIKSQPDQIKPETILSLTSGNSQPAVKSQIKREATEKSVELKSSGGSHELALKSSVGYSGTEPVESKPQQESETQIKQENKQRILVESNIAEDTKAESAQSVSDDDGIGAMDNLLGDITQIQDDLEERMDQIEQQLAVLEEAYGGTPSQLTKKTDFRKLVKDLGRVRRLLQQVS